MLALILGVYLFYPDSAPLHRFDVITLGAVAIQLGMIAFRLESWTEVRVIAVFHVVGTAMEVFKVQCGFLGLSRRGSGAVCDLGRAVVFGVHVRQRRQLHDPGLAHFRLPL